METWRIVVGGTLAALTLSGCQYWQGLWSSNEAAPDAPVVVAVPEREEVRLPSPPPDSIVMGPPAPPATPVSPPPLAPPPAPEPEVAPSPPPAPQPLPEAPETAARFTAPPPTRLAMPVPVFPLDFDWSVVPGGWVEAEVVVGFDGSVERIAILDASAPDLEAPTVIALRRARYTVTSDPTGTAIQVTLTERIEF